MKSKATGIQYQDSADSSVYDLKVQVVKDAFGKIVSGMVIGATLEQNMASIMIAEPGDLKANLTLGVGLRSALLDEDLLKYRHAIKQQFATDGINIKHLDLYNLQKFSIDAEYE
ncbi:hypothetical protein [Chryseobacterium koreense]|uniref:Uncharacterized protein n=1 Tax=Chryseobacterium koreense CCUG 49689 TaxID=1304281 RepID=A0A0J7IWH0_9FLAO|nr:hypothetical protein [Chryseobacterium koreense]KMQ70307.1 hypothetical protein ACM44_12870 [Chryseobacterium koreense CCUG 49689]MBB5334472.1 hypothetical protein [Chryseobacterium koreense]